MDKLDYRFHSVEILTAFDRENRRLSSIINDYFESKLSKSTSRNTITYLVQETIRWRGYLDWVISNKYRGRYHKVQYRLKNILRLGCYELIFREQTPDYAVVNSAVSMARLLVNRNSGGVVNAILRQIDQRFRPDLDSLNESDTTKQIASVTSHPEWMIKRWLNHFGFKDTIKLCKWNNKTPQFTIRRNLLKVDRISLEQFLTRSKIDWKRNKLDPNFYTVNHISKLKNSDEFKRGFFSFQDVSSGLITHLIDAKEGDTVLDVCAAPGGKSSYLSERLENNITIRAYDVDENRLMKIVENFERLGLDNVVVARANAVNDKYPPAKHILIDVPCTGTGVMAKRADLRWRRSKDDIKEMQKLQLSILGHIASIAVSGTNIVYSSCSLEREENQDVIDIFIKNDKNFYLIPINKKIPSQMITGSGAFCTFPPRDQMDGVFSVKIVKR